MKKIVWLSFACLSLLVSSCTKEDNEKNEENQSVSLVGVWLWQSETIGGESIDLDECEATFTYTFDTENNFIDNQPLMVAGVCTDDIRNGSYSVDSNTLSLIFEGDSAEDAYVIEFDITDNVLTMRNTNANQELAIASFTRM